MASEHDALTESKCPELNFFYKGKVRDVYQITDDTYLFVATDRISSFDKVMKNGIAGKGKILTQLSKFWFDFLEEKVSRGREGESLLSAFSM